MEPKSILRSKTFWFNVVSLVATVGGFLPPQYAAVIVPAANVLLRAISEGRVTIPGWK